MVRIKSRIFWSLVALVLAVGIGIAANPLISNPSHMSDAVGDCIVVGLGLAGLCLCLWAVMRRWRRPDVLHGPEWDDSESRSTLPFDASRDLQARDSPGVANPCDLGTGQSRRVDRLCQFVSGLTILVLWLLLFRERLLAPELYADDIVYVKAAASWESTRAQLFIPSNGQLSTLVRFVTWAVCAAVSVDAVPVALSGLVILLFVATWPLIFVFLSREWNSPFLALVAVCLFALTRAHQEVILWYSAGVQFLVSLHLSLISLVILQGARGPTHVRRLMGSFVCAALAPFCGSPGLLVGPISAVYLACGSDRHRPGTRYWQRVLVPLAGTVASALVLVIVLKVGENAAMSMRSPFHAVHNGVRATVDVLLLGNAGLNSKQHWPRWLYAGTFLLAVCGLVELFGRVRRMRWAVVGIALVVLSDVLILTFRTWLSYDAFRSRTRYQLFAQLGLSILVAGAVGEFWPHRFSRTELQPRDLAVLMLVASLLFALHVVQPASIGG